MTREELLSSQRIIRGRYKSKVVESELIRQAAHDQEQRKQIEIQYESITQLCYEIEQLVEKVKAYEGGCLHDSLVAQAQKIEQQSKEIDRLIKELEHGNN